MKQGRTHLASREASHADRVLVIGSDATTGPLSRELTRRGADVSAIADIGRAAEALRKQPLDIVIVTARPDADATALLIALARASTNGKATILLLVDLAQAERYGRAMFAADEILGLSLTPQRIADATGVGLRCAA